MIWFVDMSSNLNKNNIAILKVCNRIVCVLTPNRIDEVKMKFVDKELERLQNRGSINVIKEILLVANKWEVSNPSWIDYYKFQGQIIRHRIPFVPNLMSNSLNNGSRFNNSVNEVLNDLMV